MKKQLLLFAVLLSVTLVTASPVEELFSSDVTQLSINIAQNESVAHLYLNTSNTSFDMQSFEYNGFTINNVQVSKILSQVNGEVYLNDSVIQFNSLNIEQSTLLSSMIDMFLSCFI